MRWNNEIVNLKMACRMMRRNGYPFLTARQVIQKAIDEHGSHLSLGWSGGRCSTVVLHMALQMKPDIKVVYCNTGIEFPENVTYVHDLAEKWGVNLAELHPDTTFWKIVDEYGMPSFRAFGSDKQKKREKGATKDRRPYCCYLLKEKPRYLWYKENEITGDITGLRACESKVRAVVIGQKGMNYTPKREPALASYHPIALWSDRKMMDYLQKYSIPDNPIYQTQKRNGCWACTAYKGWQDNIKRYNPKMYELLQHKKGIMLMSDYIPNLGPCEEIDDERV